MSPSAGGDPRRALGAMGEAAAERWLRRAGYTIVARGFRIRLGEIDIVARQGGLVVFVEVKTRRGEGFGRPSEAVTPAKQRRLAHVAQVFLGRSGWSDLPCRFDVVEVLPGDRGLAVRHIADAFRPGV